MWEATTTDPLTPTPFRLVAVLCFILCRVLIMVFYVSTIVRCVHNENLAPPARAHGHGRPHAAD